MNADWRLHNDQQRASTLEWVRQFRRGADGPIPVEPIQRAAFDAALCMADMLQAQIDEYDAWQAAVKRGRVASTTVTRIEDLGAALIRARHARGWGQARLADELGVSIRTIANYEGTLYRGVGLERCQDVATLLGADVVLTVSVSPTPTAGPDAAGPGRAA